MNIKTKLTSLITTFVLLCSLLTVGVFAVKNTTFNVGGDIVFDVKGIEATIKMDSYNGFATTNEKVIGTDVLTDIELNNDMSAQDVADEFAPWSGLELAFSSSTATINLKIKNQAKVGDDNYIDITAITNATTKNNAKVSVANNAGGITALLAPQQSASFTITFSVFNDEYSANLDGFSVNFEMQKKVIAEFPVLSADNTYQTFLFKTIENQSGLSVEDIGAEQAMNEYKSEYYQSTGAIEIPAYVVDDGEIKAVTEIAFSAFSECGFNSHASITSVIIPDTVTKIGVESFIACSDLESVRMSRGVVTIDSYAFASCTKLNTIYLPNTISNIIATSFSSTKVVNYGGSEEEWNNIAFDGGVTSCFPSDVVVNYNYVG